MQHRYQQRNTNQNHNDVSPHTHEDSYYKKKKKRENNKCSQGCVEIRTLVYYWWDCKMVQQLWKTV